ncbi:putative oxidoreductase [Rhodococcus maanshanensis]|uniref:Putative oxidoreductase n=1 Tax=Rhodococcus maanshanensis TaxID=183556 RepID=A0A1H7FEM7_9NOCA|nr:putative oxidoreductase [Rhodococcus maanshanensis]
MRAAPRRPGAARRTAYLPLALTLSIVTAKQQGNPDRDGTDRTASSPFDLPTEQLPTSSSGALPVSDDDLGLMPTEQIPTYRGSSVAEVYPTEELRFADPIEPAVVSAFTSPVSQAMPETISPETPSGRGTLDLGLLVLRLGLGTVALFHGLQKLFGWWNGPGLAGFETTLFDAGFEQARLLSILGAVGEVAAGTLLIFGLATPLAGAAVLAVLINAWCVRQVAEPGLQFFAPSGVEHETMLVAAAVAVILTGPGRFSVDGGRKWATRPHVGSFVALILGVAAGVCLWIFLNGANPLI